MKQNPLRKNEQGQAIVIMALAMIALLAFAALAIDGGNAYVERRRSQNGADAAALAGARQVWLNRVNTESSETLVREVMNSAAEKNGIGDSNNAPGDDVNGYVRAYYTDRNGNPMSDNGTPIEVGARGSIPANAGGLTVYASRDFKTFIAGIIGRTEMAAMADATAVIIPPAGCGDYAIYGAGPSQNGMSVHVTGSSGQGPAFQIVDGGIYGGDGGLIQNSQVVGNGIHVDLVDGCNGTCSVSGNPIVNYDAQPQPELALYRIADFQPGGQYAVIVGNNYHFYDGGQSFRGPMASGLYYVNGDVDLHDVDGNVSIVATGQIRLNGVVRLSTYDLRFPVLFTTYDDPNGDAIKASYPDLELHGFIYAPGGAVNISGAEGVLYGAVYAREVSWDASRATIIYDQAFCPPQQAWIRLLK